MARQGTVSRQTAETTIELTLNLDGTGQSTISTGVGFLDHMLTLWAKHGLFDLTVNAKGDLDVDFHHTVEDVGICLGTVFRQALGEARGITRYASLALPMDEALCEIAVDVSNRTFLHFGVDFPKSKIGDFDAELVGEFFQAFVTQAHLTLHVDVVRGTNLHHISEACFKALGVVLSRAVQVDPRKGNQVPSTKGIL